MWRAGLRALLSHWRRHPLQLAMCLLGLALATGLWSGVQAINAEARASYDRAAALLGQNRLERIVAEDGGPIAQSRYVALRRTGWPVSPVIEGRPASSDLRIVGIEPLTLPPGEGRPGPADTEVFQAFLSPEGLALVAPETLAQLTADPAGQPILQALPPLRADPGVPPGTLVMDIGRAQTLLGADGRISHMLVVPGPIPQTPLPSGLSRRAAQDGGDIARLTDSFHLNLTAFGFLAFAVGLFIVHSAIGLAFEQRRPVFRTLRALGLSARVLTTLLLAELLVLAGVAGLIGVALGYVIAGALLPDVAATLRGLYGAEVAGTLALRPGWWAAGLAIAVAGTLVAAAQSLWRIAHLPVLAPAQPRAWARASARALAIAGDGRRGPDRCVRRDAGRGAGIGRGVRRAGRAAAGCGFGAASGTERVGGTGRAAGHGRGRPLVLGRYPPAGAGAVAGADGALAGAGREHRGGHDGVELSADLHRLARPTARLGALRQRARRGRGRATDRMARPAHRGGPADLEGASHDPRPARRGLWRGRPRNLPRPLAVARRARPMPGMLWRGARAFW